MGKRAQRRRRGQRKEAAKAEKKLAMKMWRKLSDTEHKHGYTGQPDLDVGFFYAPYMPIMRPGGFSPIVTDTTA